MNLAIYCALTGMAVLACRSNVDRRRWGTAAQWALIAIFFSGFAAAEWVIDGVRA